MYHASNLYTRSIRCSAVDASNMTAFCIVSIFLSLFSLTFTFHIDNEFDLKSMLPCKVITSPVSSALRDGAGNFFFSLL